VKTRCQPETIHSKSSFGTSMTKGLLDIIIFWKLEKSRVFTLTHSVFEQLAINTCYRQPLEFNKIKYMQNPGNENCHNPPPPQKKNFFWLKKKIPKTTKK